MSFLLFGDQSLDTHSFLANFCRSGNASTLATAFLERTATLLQDEVAKLPVLERQLMPDFATIAELNYRYHSNDARHSAVDSALLVAIQLAHYIDRAEKVPEDARELADTVAVGLCTGLFAAAAVSISPSLSALVTIGAEIVCMAFRTGRCVAGLGNRLHESTVPESWTYIVPQITEDEAGTLLNEFNTKNAYTLTQRVYISAITTSSVAFSGPPTILKKLFEQHQFKPRPLPLPIYGPYHSAELHASTSIDNVLQLETPAIQQLLGELKPRIPVMSCSTGDIFDETDAIGLIKSCVKDMLHKPLRCTAVLDSCATKGQALTTCLVIPLGPTQAANSLVQSLKSNENLEVHLRRAPYADKVGAPRVGDHGISSNINLAIVGMAGRFPDSATHEALWDLLEKGVDAHREVPPDRFDVKTHVDVTGKTINTSQTPYGCWIKDPGFFDPRFFNMSPREAYQTCPMQRMAITTAYEALEMSGYVPNRTRSTKLDRVATFYGQTSDDWREVNSATEVDTYYITGGVRAFGPGRINYHFGFSGPSYIVDTACSSSMAAAQLAITSLRAKDCDTAIIGGLSCMTNPDVFAGLCRGQFLSKKGPCATWDDEADGYCRADGCSTIIMKRYEDAIADKDNILAVVMASATNHSADAVSITHPHGGTQEELYKNILNQAGVDPLDVDYVELHGTGTQAGDATEMSSVTNVFAPSNRQRRADQPLYLGSIKANVGHGEAASGLTAIIKVLMMLQKNMIPPHIGIKNRINRTFPTDLAQRNVHIPFKPTEWLSQRDEARTVYINNFSAAGGNSGMLLKDAPKTLITKKDPRGVHILTITAKSKTALLNNAASLIKYITDFPETELADIAYTTTARRIQHNWRMSITGFSSPQVMELIKSKMTEEIVPIPRETPKIAFAFTGQGSHYPALGKELYDTSSVFRDNIDEFNNIGMMYGFPSFVSLIDGSVTDVSTMSPVVVQLGLLCFEMAMTRLWKSWGIVPSVVMGHSLGEYAALNAAGVISASDAIYLVGSRAQLLTEKCTVGSHGMLAVKASVPQVKDALNDQDINIACINGPAETVVSGEVAQITAAAERLAAAGLKCTQLKVPFAFHSSQVDPILEDFKKLASSVTFNVATTPVISTLLGRQLEQGELVDPEYLCRHAREAVDFLGGIVSSRSFGVVDDKTIFLEVGPHPVCMGMVKSTLGPETITLSSLRKIESPFKTITGTLSTLHSQGLSIDWNEFHRDHLDCLRLLSLPAYSFDEKNYWLMYTGDWCLTKGQVAAAAPKPKLIEAAPKISTTTCHRVIEEEVNGDLATVTVESDLSRPDLRAAVMGHLVNGAGLCPSSIYADMALTICEYAYKLVRPNAENVGMNVANMEVSKPLIARGEGISHLLRLTAKVDAAAGTAKLVYSSGEGRTRAVHANSTVYFGDRVAWAAEWERSTYLIQSRIDWLQEAEKRGEASKIGRGLAYKLFAALVEYDPKYRGMEEVTLSSENMEATSKVRFQTKPSDGTFNCSPYWIDSVAHISGFIVNGSDAVDSRNNVYVSHGWESWKLAEPLSADKTYRSYVRMQPAGKQMVAGDVYVFDGSRVVAICGGLKFQCIPRAVLNQLLPPIGGAAAPVARAAPASAPKPVAAKAPVKKMDTAQVTKKTLTAVSKKLATVTSQVMEIIAKEVGVSISELTDNIEFSDFGVDSLMSLTISGRIREDMELDISSNIFLDHPTVAEFKKEMLQFEKPEVATVEIADSSASDESTDDSTAELSDVSSLSTPPDDSDRELNKDEQLRQTILDVIKAETGADADEILECADLALLGVDSLMALTVLGRLREETGLDFPSDLFLTSPSIKEIEKELNIGAAPAPKPKPAPPAKKAAPKAAAPKAAPVKAVTISEPVKANTVSKAWKASSDLLQGKPRTATQTLWMVPDGSGSATSYIGIPEISPKLAVRGLNSPFMRTPEEWTCGIKGMATYFIEEMKRHQPSGPYMLAGWSAGGVICYEMTRQFIEMGDVVSHMIMVDAPCPLIIEPLPSSLHHWLAEIGMLGPGGIEALPKWLLPHFGRAVVALCTYTAVPIEAEKAPLTTMIWCEHGVCKEESDPRPEPYPYGHAQFLLENKTDLGPNLWDTFLPEEKIVCTSMPGNHFSIMAGEGAKRLGELLGEAIGA